MGENKKPVARPQPDSKIYDKEHGTSGRSARGRESKKNSSGDQGKAQK